MEIDQQSPLGLRLAEGMKQLMNGEGVERPEWTRFKEDPVDSAERIGCVVLDQAIED